MFLGYNFNTDGGVFHGMNAPSDLLDKFGVGTGGTVECSIQFLRGLFLAKGAGSF